MVVGDLQRAISDITYVVITVELYRLSVHYLKYHRVDVNTLVEVGVSAITQKVILVGVDRFTVEQLVGISLILAALGAVLWAHREERPRQAPYLRRRRIRRRSCAHDA